VEGVRAARCGRLVLLLLGACSWGSFVGVASLVFLLHGLWMDGKVKEFGVLHFHTLFS
jgi:hypothetical protein